MYRITNIYIETIYELLHPTLFQKASDLLKLLAAKLYLSVFVYVLEMNQRQTFSGHRLCKARSCR